MSFFKKLFQTKPKPMNWREFTKLYAQRIQQEFECTVELEWGDDLEDTSIYVTMPNGEKGKSYTSNLYARYRQNPDELEHVIHQGLLCIQQMAEQEEETIQAHQILPSIKPTAWLQGVKQMYVQNNQNPAEFVCYHYLAGDLGVTYMIDSGQTMSNFTRTDMPQIGIETDKQLFELALQNLDNYVQRQEGLHYISRQTSNLRQLVLDRDYDASLILMLPTLLSDLDITFPTYPVFAVPARDSLLICDASDTTAIQEMQDVVQKVFQNSAYLISEQLYCWRDEKIAVWQPN